METDFPVIVADMDDDIPEQRVPCPSCIEQGRHTMIYPEEIICKECDAEISYGEGYQHPEKQRSTRKADVLARRKANYSHGNSNFPGGMNHVGVDQGLY